MSKIRAPFTPQQVERLNAYQRNGVFHPFTCPHDSAHVLIATTTGWYCPHHEIRQDWAHSFMLAAGEIQMFTREQYQRMRERQMEISYHSAMLRMAGHTDDEPRMLALWSEWETLDYHCRLEHRLNEALTYG